MMEILIYTTLTCPYCINAKNLLEAKGALYKEIRIDENNNGLEQMLQKSNGAKSVPQIFIGNKHIGGFDDLNALNSQGKLDELLG